MRLLHFLRTEFVLVSHLRHLKYPNLVQTIWYGEKTGTTIAMNWKEGLNTKKLMTYYLECGSMERLMKFHNIWGFCSMLDFPFWQRLCLCVLEIQWILHTSDFTPGQITISATRFRFHSFTVSLCSRVRKGDSLATMAHFRSPLLFLHTPSPHTGSPRQGYDHKRKNGAKGQNVS